MNICRSNQDLLPDNELCPGPRTLEDVFSHNVRTVDRLYQKGGLTCLERLRDNISQSSLVSLFSGLGGAELVLENIYAAVCVVCERAGLRCPERPRHLDST